ncbi:dTDP-glucose 4,6-dehydratase [Patescibacteria group bacterium]|nr:dTDP-glucose 4,6-dehydratase [Patescibacteria group bacterium]MBU2259486.1 dTDP-glucose 4,6-dehydratase [Patescibacteria group bacterium]
MNLLVTGGAGFIGSHFVLRHIENHPDDQVIVLDLLTYAADKSYLDPVEGQIQFIHGDIADQTIVTQIVEDRGIDAIVDFAAETHVDNSIADAAPFLQTNVIGVQSLIEVCKENPKILLLHVSTDEVYGGLKDSDSSCTPETALNPGNPYSASKAAGDLLILAAVSTYGIRARITRCTNNFGPHQADEKFLPTIIRSALSDEPIPVYGEGKQKRDWLFVTDHTDATEAVLEKGKDGEIYLISADSERENIETAKMMLDALGKSHDLISFVDDRPGHDWRYALDSSSTKELGWEPKVSFEEGIKKTVEWYQEKYS